MSTTLSTMLTQCPACHTLFRIRGEQLRAADGQARCCRCNQVFDALANLRDEPVPVQRHALSSQWAPRAKPGPLPLPRRSALERAHPAGAEPAAGDAEAGRLVGTPGTGAEPAPVRSIPPAEFIDTAPALAESVGPEAARSATFVPTATTPESPPFEIPEDLPEIEPSEDSGGPLWAEETEPAPGPSPWAQLGWGLGALLLLTGALGQLLWWDREALAQSIQGRRIIEPFCATLGCQVAPRRAIDRIRVLSRDVSPHPSERQALLIMLVMANEASFAQPFPLLQLTLYDDQERAMGQRRFTPQEYLGDADVPLMKPDQAVYVRLELVDPGTAVTGFRFDFL